MKTIGSDEFQALCDSVVADSPFLLQRYAELDIATEEHDTDKRTWLCLELLSRVARHLKIEPHALTSVEGPTGEGTLRSAISSFVADRADPSFEPAPIVDDMLTSSGI